MQTEDAILKRRSVREFSGKKIPKDILVKLVGAARLAPTARNEQPWEFIVITDENIKNRLSQVTHPNGPFIADCAACIAVFCLDTKYYLEDGCAATENILLMAADSGIASCWVAGDKKPYCEQIKTLLNVPDKYKLISLIALGYGTTRVEAISKRETEELLHWEKF